MKRIILILIVLMTLSPFAQADATNFSKFDLAFNFGPSLSQSGNIKDLGDPSFNAGLGFNFFFKENHGVGFSYINEAEFDGSRRIPIRNASITTFDIHYAGRYFFHPRFSVQFEPGFGWQTLWSSSTDPYWGYVYSNDLSTGMTLQYKLMARYSFVEWNQNTSSKSSLYGGVGIQQIFTLNDDLYGKDISGSRMSLLFQIGLGF